MVSMSPEILKIKLDWLLFEFKSIEKVTLTNLKEKMTSLSDKLQEQTQKNKILENEILELRQ